MAVMLPEGSDRIDADIGDGSHLASGAGRGGALSAVRRARPGDAAGIHRVRVFGWRAAYAGMVPAAYLDTMRLDDEAVRAVRDRLAAMPPGWQTFVAIRDDQVVGFTVCGMEREGLGPEPPPGGDPSRGEVYALYVLPDRWGGGHGAALLETATAALAHGGATQVTLWVLEANTRARRFYERHGFAPTGQRQTIDLGEPVPEVRYARPLPPVREVRLAADG